jgi:HEAT repeat protein
MLGATQLSSTGFAKLLAAAALIALVAPGCGGDSPKKAADSAPSAAEKATPEPKPAAKASPAPKKTPKPAPAPKATPAPAQTPLEPAADVLARAMKPTPAPASERPKSEAELLLEAYIAATDDAAREQAAQALAALGAEGAQTVAQGLKSRDKETRQRAADLRAHFPNPEEQRAFLLAEVESPAPDVREKALDALAADLRPDALEALARLSVSEPNSVQRRKSVELLGQIGSAHALGGLRIKLRDKDPGVREAAVRGLGRIKDPRVAGFLRDVAASDKDSAVREAAQQILENLEAEAPAGAAVEVAGGQ